MQLNRLFLIIGVLLPSLLSADLNKDLNKFYSKFGGHSNITSGSIYQGQKAGYMTGGGFSTRSRIMNSELASISLPKFNAGCGGIDLHMGGFSFINKNEIINTLKSIAGDSLGYAFMLGMETMSPQIASTMKDLQSKMQAVNNMSINSCETASQLVGSVWPKDSLASQHICRSTAASRGTAMDFVDGRHKCSESSGFSKEEEGRSQDPNYQDLLGSEYNIAWKVINKHSFLKDNRQLAELFMSLTGTIIYRLDEGNKVIEYKGSKIDDQDFISSMLSGGKLEIYHCEEEKNKTDTKCLIVNQKKIYINKEESWEGKVKSTLKSMQDKIFEDKELNDKEIELLETSRLPLYRIINVMTAFNYNTLDLIRLSNMVALDILHQYIREVLELSREGAEQLKRSQAFEGKITEYLKGLERLEEKLVKEEEKNHRIFEKENTLFQQVDYLEGVIHNQINF